MTTECISNPGAAIAKSSDAAPKDDFIFSRQRFRRSTVPNPLGKKGESRVTASVGFVACVTLDRIFAA
jgi:hypothetical protein